MLVSRAQGRQVGCERGSGPWCTSHRSVTAARSSGNAVARCQEQHSACLSLLVRVRLTTSHASCGLLRRLCSHSYLIPDGRVSAKDWQNAITEAVRQCREDLTRFERDNALVRRGRRSFGHCVPRRRR